MAMSRICMMDAGYHDPRVRAADKDQELSGLVRDLGESEFLDEGVFQRIVDAWNQCFA